MQCNVCEEEITPMNGPFPTKGYNVHDMENDKLVYCCSDECCIEYLKKR